MPVKFLLVVVFVALCAPSWADTPDNRPPDNRPPDTSGGEHEHSGDVTATATSNLEITINNLVSEPGSAEHLPTTNTLIVNEAADPSSIKIKNTPTVIASDVYPTVPCFKGASGGFSLPGFGASASAGKIDEDCVKREYIRIAYAMGLLARATYMWCKQPAVYEDFGTAEDCLLFEVKDDVDDGLSNLSKAQIEEQVSNEIEPLRIEVAGVNDSLDQLVARMERNEAVRRSRDQQREQFKVDIAVKYLPSEAGEGQ